MANVITYEYFRGSLNLPQTISAEGQGLLTQFITQYEDELLEKALGRELGLAFKANLASADPIWVALRDGVNFTNSRGQLDRWVGFKDDTNKLSPIANYVFYKFVEDGITQAATSGVVITKAENADPVYPQLKLQEAWNRMAEMLRKLHDYLLLNREDYPAFNYYRRNDVTKKLNQFGI